MKVSQTEAQLCNGFPGVPNSKILFIREVDRRALIALTGTAARHWFRYVDDTWVKIRIRKLEAFTEHIYSVDNNIKFTGGDVKGDCLPFLDCAVNTEEDRSLNI